MDDGIDTPLALERLREPGFKVGAGSDRLSAAGSMSGMVDGGGGVGGWFFSFSEMRLADLSVSDAASGTRGGIFCRVDNDIL